MERVNMTGDRLNSNHVAIPAELKIFLWMSAG
jgi:hypothetical protein